LTSIDQAILGSQVHYRIGLPKGFTASQPLLEVMQQLSPAQGTTFSLSLSHAGQQQHQVIPVVAQPQLGARVNGWGGWG
jgi:hypothetical protein